MGRRGKNKELEMAKSVAAPAEAPAAEPLNLNIAPEQAPGPIKEESSGEPKAPAKQGVKVKQKGRAKPPSRFAKFGG